MKYTFLGILCIAMLAPCCVKSQAVDSVNSPAGISPKLSEKYIQAMETRSSDAQVKMEKETGKYLDKLKDRELKLQKQLSKVDPAAATRIFGETSQKYDNLQNDLKNNSQRVLKTCGKYVPGIDSAITSLKFLQQNNALSGKLGSEVSQIKSAMSKVRALEDQFKKTDNVEDFVKQREQYLQQQLSSYNIPGLQQYNQQAAFYAQQMAEIKQDWEDPSRMEQKAMTILNKIPAFQDFIKKNSAIAGLFNLPGDYGSTGLGGLQTRDMVQKMMQESMTNLGPNGAQTAQQNIGQAQSGLSDLRSKLNQGGSELSMPNGQGNSQHTKSLFKRIQYGFDVQSTKSNYYFPNQSSFSLTAGYKLDDRNTVGIGLAYSVGWGKDIQHISVTSQGIGFRSFGDFKIKGSLYGSGGFEYNYTNPFFSISQLRVSGLWQRSGLIGLTKLVSVKSNLVKKTKIQLLFNFLSFYQIPQSQPIIFRLGYNF